MGAANGAGDVSIELDGAAAAKLRAALDEALSQVDVRAAG
jgi:hypothetical protein